MAQIPSPKSPRWYCRTTVLEAVPAVGGFGLTFLLALRVYSQSDDLWEVAWIICFALSIAISVVIVAFRRWPEENKKIALDEPVALKIHVRRVHADVMAVLPSSYVGDDRLRLTLHKVVWDSQGQAPKELVQVLRYVGGRGKLHRRRFPVRVGIIGLVARTKDGYWASAISNSTPNDYRESLVSQWGFTWDEAQERTLDRRSWMALPLLDERGERVIGVFYADSDDENMFKDPAVRQIVWSGTQTLAELIHESYS